MAYSSATGWPWRQLRPSLYAVFIMPPAIPQRLPEETLIACVILQAQLWPAGLVRSSLPKPAQWHGQCNAVF